MFSSFYFISADFDFGWSKGFGGLTETYDRNYRVYNFRCLGLTGLRADGLDRLSSTPDDQPTCRRSVEPPLTFVSDNNTDNNNDSKRQQQ